MNNAIILHGTTDTEEYYSNQYPSLSNSHWLPWLQKQLLIKDVHAHTPEIFKAHIPDYDSWVSEFERHEIGPDTILVGHSCGAGFIVRWLSEHPAISVGKVVLVAPWMDPGRKQTTDFFEFKIDSNIANRTRGLTIFHSTNDMEDVCITAKELRHKLLNYKYVEFTKHGHFCFGDLGTEEFPELLEEILKDA